MANVFEKYFSANSPTTSKPAKKSANVFDKYFSNSEPPKPAQAKPADPLEGLNIVNGPIKLGETKPAITPPKNPLNLFLPSINTSTSGSTAATVKEEKPKIAETPKGSVMVFKVGENMKPDQVKKAEKVLEKKPVEPQQNIFDKYFNNINKRNDLQDRQPTKEELDQLKSSAAGRIWTRDGKTLALDRTTGRAEFVPTVDPTGAIGGMENVAAKSASKILPMAETALNNADGQLMKEAEGYVKEQIAAREAARKSDSPGVVGKVKNFLGEIKAKLVDSNAPIEDVLNKTLKDNNIVLPPKDHITNQIDRVYRTPSIAGQFARDNGIEKVIKEVDNLDNLDQYLIAKQAKDVEARGIKTGRDLAKDDKLIAAFQDKYEPYAQQVNDYSRKLLDYSVDSGLVSRETADMLKERYPNYVPINRIFNELEKGGQFGTKAVASLSKQSVVQKLAGSERQIESPITSLLEKTTSAFQQGEKNKAAKILAGYKELPENPFQLRELKSGESASHTISFLENGVKKTFETTKEIADAAKALNVQQLNILGKIFAAPVRLAKVGITGINLPFVASNVAKDQISAFINSDKALRTSIANPVNFVKSLFEAVGHGELYQEMVRAGGGGTSFDIARNQIAPTIERARAGRNIGTRILYTVKHPSELLRAVEDIIGRSEELTRLQQYRATKNSFLKQGMDAENAMVAGAKAARENTVNFSRRGEWGNVLNSAFLYLNANIQGTRTLVRNMTQKPAQTAVKIGISVFTPVAATTLWNLSDPQRKAAYEDIAEYEKENNIIIIPPNPTKDENGKWNVIKIPLSQEINKIASLARRPIEQSFGLDPVKAGEVANAFIGTVSPIDMSSGSLASTLTPQAIKPSLEAYSNKNFFTGLKQVPDSMANLSPELQAKPNTSGTARKIGELTKQPPIKVEEFIKGTVGGVGSQVLHFTDMALAGMDIIPKDQVHGQSIIDAITARFSKATGGAADDKQTEKLKEIITKQADDRFRLKQEAEVIYKELKNLPKEEANAKADGLKGKNPALYEQLKTVVDDNRKGLDYNDRLMKQLGVTNGERAKFIWETLKTYKTKDDKNKYVQGLRDKGIISDEVFKQLLELKQNEQN